MTFLRECIFSIFALTVGNNTCVQVTSSVGKSSMKYTSGDLDEQSSLNWITSRGDGPTVSSIIHIYTDVVCCVSLVKGM